MNAQKAAHYADRLNGTARHVYDVLPDAEAVSPQWVIGAMARAGYRASMEGVRGSLRTITSFGLARETKDGNFAKTKQRVPDPTPAPDMPRKVVSISKEEPVAVEPEKVAITAKPDALERLASVAERMTRLRAEMDALVSEVEAVALEVTEQIESVRAEQGKYRQLGELLASFRPAAA